MKKLWRSRPLAKAAAVVAIVLLAGLWMALARVNLPQTRTSQYLHTRSLASQLPVDPITLHLTHTAVRLAGEGHHLKALAVLSFLKERHPEISNARLLGAFLLIEAGHLARVFEQQPSGVPGENAVGQWFCLNVHRLLRNGTPVTGGVSAGEGREAARRSRQACLAQCLTRNKTRPYDSHS